MTMETTTNYSLFAFGGNKRISNYKKKDSSTDSYTSRSSFRGGGGRRSGVLPLLTQRKATIAISYLVICIIYPGAGSQQNSCSNVPKRITNHYCVCQSMSSIDTHSLSLVCKGLNTTDIFSPRELIPSNSGKLKISTNSLESKSTISEFKILSEEESAWTDIKKKIRHVIVQDSDLNCVSFSDFKSFTYLDKLVITNSKVHKLNCDTKVNNKYESENIKLESVKHLDLSSNHIRLIKLNDFKSLPNVKIIDLSRNWIQHIEDVFRDLTQLEKLDLSSNQLNANLRQSVFDGITKSIKWLDVSNNTWPCSPDLSWMYNWSNSFGDSNTIINSSSVTCEVDTHPYPLFLVMQAYTDEVLPSCPKEKGCECTIKHFAVNEKNQTIIHDGEIYGKYRYNVKVSCSGKGLTEFPKLPKYTRVLDLSNNKLDGTAFESLAIDEQNYEKIENLTLDNNHLESLPNKLLKMKLKIGFSVQSNKLTSISYDLSQRLISYESGTVIRLSNNSWICSCDSQITEKILMSKLKDKDDLKCGEKSAVKFRNKKIIEILPEELCPPEGTGESQELLLKLLCGVLSISIVVVLTKLGYDYSIYRRRGQLPWLALKMP